MKAADGMEREGLNIVSCRGMANKLTDPMSGPVSGRTDRRRFAPGRTAVREVYRACRQPAGVESPADPQSGGVQGPAAAVDGGTLSRRGCPRWQRCRAKVAAGSGAVPAPMSSTGLKPLVSFRGRAAEPGFQKHRMFRNERNASRLFRASTEVLDSGLRCAAPE